MKALLIILFMTLSVISHAEYTYVKPHYILLDKDKNPVPNVTKSTDDSRCIHKASMQLEGVYYCQQADIRIAVTGITETSNKVTVSWTAPTENTDGSLLTDLVGFKVYYGESEDDLSTVVNIDSALTNSVEIDNLPSNDYYFAVTAVNSSGIESVLSNVVTKKKTT